MAKGSSKGSAKGSSKARRCGAAARRAPRRRRRSFLGTLVYGTMILGFWGLVAVAGLVAYHASQLPPIDQLAVPKRPPNIAILAADARARQPRRDRRRTVSIRELPPYPARAFVAIEDRRFYGHMGIDPVGIARAIAQNLTRRA